MKVKTLDGKIVDWKIKSKNEYKKSKLQQQFIELFKSNYDVTIKEEVAIRVLSNKVLFLDYFIPIFDCAIEINGQQHEKYSKHFHGNKYNFYLRQVTNDSLKRQWCELNNIFLLELGYDNVSEWGTILRKKFG